MHSLPILLSGLLLLGGAAWADGVGEGFGDAFPQGAPPMPVCNAPREGVAACLGGKQCLCRFERGGSLTGRQDGFRWDCGPLRPACPDPAPPAAVPMPLPPVVLPDWPWTPRPSR
ncbi:hypothetical protein LPC08_03940 [Roseomonas sp. OT10]|uniref:hypothetical protein n=1 Tax=Roseomonas cutis TaxID=2897332 RepID=UPI001E492630|nr:hypothetical protein [Roseomonas sp. OT10]UFN49806.1 hypothetical protein LPC08_03940 [Roseomonas sp. OT10]